MVGEQPFHRPLAERGHAFLHLFRLLGGVDMGRRIGRNFGKELAQRCRVHRAQRMRRHSGPHIRRERHCAHRGEDLPDSRIKAFLSRLQCALAESGPAVKRWQGSNRNPCLERRLEMRTEHLLRVMQVVELRDGGIAVLQQLDVKVARNRARLLRREALHEAVHELAPGPEIVLAAGARFGEPRHTALKRMRMEIRHSR